MAFGGQRKWVGNEGCPGRGQQVSTFPQVLFETVIDPMNQSLRTKDRSWWQKHSSIVSCVMEGSL